MYCIDYSEVCASSTKKIHFKENYKHIIAMQCVISEHDCLLQNSMIGS